MASTRSATGVSQHTVMCQTNTSPLARTHVTYVLCLSTPPPIRTRDLVYVLASCPIHTLYMTGVASRVSEQSLVLLYAWSIGAAGDLTRAMDMTYGRLVMAVALQEGSGERERERVGERERERDTYHPYICAEASMRRHTTGGTFLGGGGREDDVFGMNRQELENDREGDNEGSRRPPRGSSTVGSCASPEPRD